MKVSVCLRTYNHEDFVDQSVGGALSQETDFDFEVVVGDDASSDRTQEILKRLQADHPERIRLLLRETNIGSKNNLIDTYGACRGDYVAFLDGDDYWTAPDKLKRQVDYMEVHREVAVCGTRWRSESDVEAPWPRETSSLSEFIQGGRGLAMSVLMVRRCCLPSFPAWIHNANLADVIIQYLCLTRGKLAYLDGITTFYHRHDGAMFSRLSPERRIRWDTNTWEEILKNSDPLYRRPIERRLAAAYYRLSDIHRLANREEDRNSAFDRARRLGTASDFIRHLVRSRAPSIYRGLVVAKTAFKTQR